MRDRLERDVEDPREPGGGSLREARELPAVVFRQVPLRGADLLLDQVEIVEQPFAGGRHAAVGRDRLGQLVEHPVQYFLVGGQPRQQLVRRAPAREDVRASEIPTVLLHLVGTEELRPQRRFRERGLDLEATRSQRCRQASDTIEEAATRQLQLGMLRAPDGVQRPSRRLRNGTTPAVIGRFTRCALSRCHASARASQETLVRQAVQGRKPTCGEGGNACDRGRAPLSLENVRKQAWRLRLRNRNCWT